MNPVTSPNGMISTMWTAGCLIGLRQAENALGDVAEDELRRDRRDAPEQRLAQIALDVVLGGIAVAAVRHYRLLAGVEAGLARQIFRAVRLRAAGLALVIEPRGLEHHQPGRLEAHPVGGERMLDRLVLSDRPVEHHALLRILRCPLDRAAAEADELGGNQDALRVHAVQDVLEALALLADAIVLG